MATFTVKENQFFIGSSLTDFIVIWEAPKNKDFKYFVTVKTMGKDGKELKETYFNTQVAPRPQNAIEMCRRANGESFRDRMMYFPKKDFGKAEVTDSKGRDVMQLLLELPEFVEYRGYVFDLKLFKNGHTELRLVYELRTTDENYPEWDHPEYGHCDFLFLEENIEYEADLIDAIRDCKKQFSRLGVNL